MENITFLWYGILHPRMANEWVALETQHMV